MEKYFTGCETEEQVKGRYRELSKKHHPNNYNDRRRDPNPAETTARWQDIEKQKKQALRSIYKKSGLSDAEIEAKLDEFIDQVLEGDLSGINNISNSLAAEIMDQFDGDKEASFGDILKFVSNKIMGSAEKKIGPKPGSGAKKIDK